MSRRDLLIGTVGSVASTAFYPGSAEAGLPFVDLDRMVASEVVRLASGRDIDLRLLIPDGSQGNVEPVIGAFEEMTGIRVNLIVTAVDDINTRLMLDQMGGKEGYDLALPATFGIPELAEAGVLADLDALASRYEPTALREQSLYPVGDRYDGRLYGFQADGDAYLMFYNKPWLDDVANRQRYADEFGHALAIPETWRELDRQMAPM